MKTIGLFVVAALLASAFALPSPDKVVPEMSMVGNKDDNKDDTSWIWGTVNEGDDMAEVDGEESIEHQLGLDDQEDAVDKVEHLKHKLREARAAERKEEHVSQLTEAQLAIGSGQVNAKDLLDRLESTDSDDDHKDAATDALLKKVAEDKDEDEAEPPYDHDDAYLTPDGHYHLGGGRRRIGAGFQPYTPPTGSASPAAAGTVFGQVAGADGQVV
jgi:hypothetical protein